MALKNTAKYCPLSPEMQEVLTEEDAGEPAAVGPEQAQRNIRELFGGCGPDAPAGAEG